MKLNQLSEPVFSSQDLIKEIYKGNLSKIALSKIDENDLEYMSYIEFVDKNKLTDWPLPQIYFENNQSQQSFDLTNQNNWFMPEEYTNFNIVDYLKSLCVNDIELTRVNEELELFKNHNMLDLLKFLKYLVDKMREDKILWGVGRGSSVASYCLYLLGVHKIDSIKYELDIREFLR
jgi:hypothetical protein